MSLLSCAIHYLQLSNGDSDGDLIPDNEEGFVDKDMDGIPDYLDNNKPVNVIPMQATVQNIERTGNYEIYLLEGEPGVSISRGVIALQDVSSAVELTLNADGDRLTQDLDTHNIGGLVDFVINNLPEAGQTYRLVIPQRLPIPNDARYRKFKEGQWIDFIQDGRNILSSAQGIQGICPPPGSNNYTQGLTEGHWCVQLQIEDGGPNDDDGLANRAIADPGGVAVTISENSLPKAQDDNVSVPYNTTSNFNVLENDFDADNDTLAVLFALPQFGDISINSDGSLDYTPKTDFVGIDTLNYVISDGNGGTDFAIAQITVLSNTLPIALDDHASTNHLAPVIIDVLANDSDVDGDILSIINATTDIGEVTINNNQTLTYKPQERFDGQTIITYTLSDGINEVQGQAFIDVQGNRVPVANNDTASTNDRTAIIIEVLTNDTDDDGDNLWVSQAIALHGSVEVNDDSSITYYPKTGF